MKLDEYLSCTMITNKTFAARLGISYGHLLHILSKQKNASVKLARKIEEVTHGRVTKEEVLFPEDFTENN